MSMPGGSIPLRGAALCVECLVIFDMSSRGACPKCDSSLGWASVESNRAAQLIQAQRNLIDEAEGVLLTVSKRRLGPSSALCARMVERIRADRQKEKAPVSPSASTQPKEGVPVQ